MKSKYTSYNLDELVPMIERAALDLMSAPIMNGKKSDGTYMTMAEIANQNSMIAMENSGIKLLAQTLIDQLTKDDETEE